MKDVCNVQMESNPGELSDLYLIFIKKGCQNLYTEQAMKFIKFLIEYKTVLNIPTFPKSTQT